MSWEKILKDLRSRATNPDAMATRMGSAKYESQNNPMFGQGDCKVRKCDAIRCKHNLNRKCKLPEVDLDDDGQCEMLDEIPPNDT